MKTIGSLDFKFLDPEKLRALSVVEITTAETYDLDGFPIEGSLMDPRLGIISPGLRCKTCGQRMNRCLGHTGLIELIRPVFHVKFSEAIRDCLYSTCAHCGKIALQTEVVHEYRNRAAAIATEEHRVELGKEVIRKARKVKKCPHCAFDREEMQFKKPSRYQEGQKRLFPNEIRERLAKIVTEDVVLLGYDKDVRPEWWILTALAVPPVTMRPSLTLETGQKSEDDLTHKLSDIVRTNQRLKENINAGAPQIIVESMWDLLQYHVTTYFDNSSSGVPPANDRTGRPLKTLTQRLTGKEGRFRLSLSGKRVNYSARSVINPDPFISINEIGVPKEVAEKLTFPEKVTEWNLEKAREMTKRTSYPQVRTVITAEGMKKKVLDANREELANEISPNWTIERDMIDGDIMLFNRQPSLHRMSELAHKAKILPGRSFRIHPAVTHPYNADFDGDSMNVHFPQEVEAKVEAEELLMVEKHIISPRYGMPVIGAVEDLVSGAAALTMRTTLFDKEEAMNYANMLGLTELPKPKGPNGTYTGKQVFSMLLPKDLNIEFQSTLCTGVLKKTRICTNCKKEDHYDAYVVIKDGELVKGIIDDTAIGAGVTKGKLLAKITRQYGNDRAKKFLDEFSNVVLCALNKTGATISLSEFETENTTEKNKIVEETLKESHKMVEKYKDGKLEQLPGLSYDESFEHSMVVLASKAKTAAISNVLQEKIQKMFTEHPVFDAMFMMMVGARGDVKNLENISGMRGQITILQGERPSQGYEGRLTPCFEKGDKGLLAYGFVTHNLLEGVPPKEFFFDAMGGRIGEIEKSSLSTRKSGYLQRQIVYALQDLSVKSDLSVRGATGGLVQLVYGGDGVFPTNYTKKDGLFNIQELREMARKGKGK